MAVVAILKGFLSLFYQREESIELEWPGTPAPCPTGQIEPASATVDDSSVQLGMCTYASSVTFAWMPPQEESRQKCSMMHKCTSPAASVLAGGGSRSGPAVSIFLKQAQRHCWI